jgi:hypothetical protein
MLFRFLDRERDIKFSFRDVREIQSWPDVDLSDPLSGIKQLSKTLALGLRRDDAEITEEKIADILDMETLPALFEAVSAAIGNRKALSPNPSAGS